MQVAGCRMWVAEHRLQVIIESRPHFLTDFCRHRTWRISSGKTFIDMFIIIFRCPDFSSAKFYIS